MEIERGKVSIDIYDLCSILNTVGFVVVNEERSKQVRSSGRKIEIICNVSGKKVYLESTNSECFCWRHAVHDDAEKWEMSGTSGGVQTSRMESSITSWKELPKNIINFVEKTVESLVEIVRGTNVTNNSHRERKGSGTFGYIDARLNKIKADCNLMIEDQPGPHNVSRSSLNINSLGQTEKLAVKEESETMYRSLDTLTTMAVDPVLPEPGVLSGNKKGVCMVRQNTYTTSPVTSEPMSQEPYSTRTSSPVPSLAKCTMRKLTKAEQLSNELASIIQETKKIIEEETDYPGLSPYSVMDVSKISQSKGTGDSIISSNNISTKSGQPYASSPNLSVKRESRIPSSNLKRGKSASTYRVGASNIPASSLQKSSSLKRTIPKKLSTLASINPTFGSMNGRKSLGGGTMFGNQVSGTYKTIGERMSIGGTSKETDAKTRSSLYSHIKPTIQRYTPISSKK